MRGFLLLALLSTPCGGFTSAKTIHRQKNKVFALPKPLKTNGPWSSFIDENYDTIYYFNSKTGETQWEPPSNFVTPKPTKTPPNDRSIFSKLPFTDPPSNFVTPKPTKTSPNDRNIFSQLPFTDKIIPVSSPVKYEFGSNVLPHPEKRSWGGEDALFVSSSVFGVFDGVSGAEKLDGLPLYSRMLASEMQSIISNEDPTTGYTLNKLKKILTTAAEFADKDATGASTAVVASLSVDSKLRALSLGDSRCVVIRNGQIKHTTKEIVHFFDCPYQMGDQSPDRPKDATTLSVGVLPDDLIIMASDGVFDNISDDDLSFFVTKQKDKSSRAIATSLNEHCRKLSLDTVRETPYSVLAKKNTIPGYEEGVGGKVDDLSCVCVKIT